MKRKRIAFVCMFMCVYMFARFSTPCVNAYDDDSGVNVSVWQYGVQCRKNVLYRYSPEEHGYVRCKAIALTFDDGPHPKYTPKTLELLEKNNVKATFFTVGFRTTLHPHLLEKMKELNCEIGNHTYSHADLTKIGEDEIKKEIEKCNETIFSVTGEYPSIYRPPFGLISKESEKNIALKKILWDVDSYDWNTSNAEKVAKKIIDSAKDGDIILMHDFYEQTIEALPLIIDGLRQKGYEFVTISELVSTDE